VEGRVYAVEIRPVEHNTVLATEIADSTGQLTALFYGRSHIPGVECGARIRFRGQVGMRSGGPVMINPAYELVAPGAPGQAPGSTAGDGDPAQGGSPKRRGPRRRKDR
jgi:RecG-like helicase